MKKIGKQMIIANKNKKEQMKVVVLLNRKLQVAQHNFQNIMMKVTKIL